MQVNPSNLLRGAQSTLNGGTSESDRFHALTDDSKIMEAEMDESLPRKLGPLTQAQLYMIRSQVLAYKYLIRNIQLPSQLSVTGSAGANLWNLERQKITTKAMTFYRDKIQKETELKNMIIQSTRPAPREDPQEAQEQINYLVHKRRAEIDSNLEKAAGQLHNITKQRLNLELKFLGVREIYQKVLNRVVDGFRRDEKAVKLFERQLLDRNYFRREKLQRVRENGGNKVERLENQIKTDHQRRKKTKHKEFMQHLRTHKEEFFEWHRKRGKDRKKLINMAKMQFETRKKTEIEDKEQKRRIDIFINRNYDLYWEELKKAKNKKIEELLRQTNTFLKELGAKVAVQKGTDDKTDAESKPKQADNHEDDLAFNFQTENTVYYNLTHTVKEEIKTQPNMLTGGKLKSYQLAGLQWLVSLYNNNLNGILADEMGLGKTIQSISLLSYLMECKKNYGPFLIIVPLTTIANWSFEFETWAPTVRKVVYKGTPAMRNEIYATMKSTKWNVCLTTSDFILKDRLRLNKYDWKYIIVDEGHKMKNAKSKFVSILGQQYHSERRLLLTGTPLQNNLAQLWALLNFLLPKIFNSCDEFEKWFSIALPRNVSGENAKLSQEEQMLIINRLHQVLRPFLLRRVKKEVEAELPDKRQLVVMVQLSAWQKVIYQRISEKAAFQLTSNSGKIRATTLTNLMMQQRKCCNHPYHFLKDYDDICYHDWIFRSSGKFELLDRILPKLQAFKHRVLIFSQMTQLMDILQIYLDYKGVKHLRFDGNTKQEDRDQSTSLFNQENSQYDVYLLSTRAGGLGLNLQSADTVIIFDSDWNPQMDRQAQDRAHRIGQKKEVIVLRFVSNTKIELDILKKTAEKINMDEMLIQVGMYNLNSSEAERRKKIENVLCRTETGDNFPQVKIPTDEMINRFLQRSTDQYEQFTRFDQERYDRDSHLYKSFSEAEGSQHDGKFPTSYRLMTEDEIPRWFLEAPRDKQVHRQYGRGNRIRKQFNYNEEVVDPQTKKAQSLQSMEKDDDLDDFQLVQVPKKQRGSGQPRQKRIPLELILQSPQEEVVATFNDDESESPK